MPHNVIHTIYTMSYTKTDRQTETERQKDINLSNDIINLDIKLYTRVFYIYIYKER